MKIYILVDDQNIVRCMASEESNLHSNKLGMSKHYVNRGGTVGDEYDTSTDKWTPKPENYPKPSKEEIRERKIQERAVKNARDKAEQELIDEGEIGLQPIKKFGK